MALARGTVMVGAIMPRGTLRDTVVALCYPTGLHSMCLAIVVMSKGAAVVKMSWF